MKGVCERVWKAVFSVSKKAQEAELKLASHAGLLRGALFSFLPRVCGEGRNTSSPKNACVGGL